MRLLLLQWKVMFAGKVPNNPLKYWVYCYLWSSLCRLMLMILNDKKIEIGGCLRASKKMWTGWEISLDYDRQLQ
jgi:hypothetical protein